MVKLMRMSPVTSLWRPGLNVPIRKKEQRILPPVIEDLVAHYGPAQIEGSPQVTAWRNNVPGGAAFDLDNIVGVAGNLTRMPSGYARFVGEPGDYYTTESTPANSVTGALDIIWDGVLDSWDPAALTIVEGKFAPGAGLASYYLSVNPGGFIGLSLSENGTDLITAQSTIPPGFADGALNSIRAAWNGVDSVTFFELDGGWFPIGPAVPLVAASIFQSPTAVSVGANALGTDQIVGGYSNGGRILDGIDGVTVASFTPGQADTPQGDWTDLVTQAVWQPQGDAFINTTGEDVVNSAGGVGIKTAIAQVLAQPTTVFMVVKGTQAVPIENNHLFDANGAANRSYNRIVITTGEFLAFAGSQVTIAGSQSTAPHILTSVFNGASGSFEVSGFPKVDANLGANAWDFMTLFANNPVTSTAVAWIGEIIVYNGLLADDDIDQVHSYLENRWL